MPQQYTKHQSHRTISNTLSHQFSLIQQILDEIGKPDDQKVVDSLGYVDLEKIVEKICRPETGIIKYFLFFS